MRATTQLSPAVLRHVRWSGNLTSEQKATIKRAIARCCQELRAKRQSVQQPVETPVVAVADIRAAICDLFSEAR